MICANCGKNINDGIKFCPECGKAISATQAVRSTCVKCRATLKDGSKFCPVCGTPVSLQPSLTQISIESMIFRNTVQIARDRHGFTSFILILDLISCIAGTGINVFIYSDSVLHVIASLVFILAIILLLCWKKIGFWILLIGGILTIISSVNMGVSLGQSIFNIMSVIVVFGVLQLRKNNRSAWEQLE